MHPCSPLRSLLYFLLFAFSAVLLGLTAYRIHYTKTLDNGDILTSSTHFYDAIIVELLVTSCLAIIFTLWLYRRSYSRFWRAAASFMSEHIMMWIIWIMFLVGAAITTSRWDNLKWCRGGYRVCRILETIKAFGWICWGFATFIILASVIHMAIGKHSFTGHIAGANQPRSTYVGSTETRQREGGATTAHAAGQGGVTSTAPNPVPAAV